jgi:Na+-driven multidrug efflux pump
MLYNLYERCWRFKTPFYFLLISIILNIALLPILIFGWLDLPEIGLNGAAYAVVLANFITFVIMLVVLHKRNHVLKLDSIILKHLHLKGPVLKTLLKLAITLNYLLGGILILILYLIPNPILGIFLDNTETIHIAKSLIMFSFWSNVILCHTQAISATMRATGTVLWPTIFTITSVLLIEVPAAYSLSHFTTLGINGIWLAYPIAFIANFLAQSTYHQFFWKRKSLKALLN